MLSKEENARLTAVGPGSPVGELLRRYWMPIAPVAELDDSPTKAVRLLGEDLVLYKDRRGRYGLVDRRCPHRSADLSYGVVEECGLRCNYHGWLFNDEGRCLAQPFEECVNPSARFKDRIGIKAYPVQAHAGLLWAYLGPPPVPLVPNWRNFHRKGFKHVCFAHLPCNWLQAMENSFDQVHNEWMHDKWSFFVRDGSIPANRWRIRNFIHREFDYGWTAEVQYQGFEEIYPDRVILWPNYNYVHLFEWYVPVDDENTLLVFWHNVPFRTAAPFRQERIPYWTGRIHDPVTGHYLALPPRNQDVLVWIGQGRIADRSEEHLGVSDTGVLMFRRKLQEQIQIVERGGDPKGVVRDPDKYFVMLPEPVPSGPERDGLPGAVVSRSDMQPIGYLAGFPSAIGDEIKRIATERGEGTRRAPAPGHTAATASEPEFDRDRHYGALRKHGLTDGAGTSPGWPDRRPGQADTVTRERACSLARGEPR
jgi:5,5'-dehydrodivanillate O-demethylase